MRFLFGLIVLVLMAMPAPAYAQSALIGFTPTEKVGFAFYHFINRDPPVEDWIINRDDYQQAMPNVRLEIMDHERLRLREGYASYLAERDLISLKVPMQFDMQDNPDYKTTVLARTKALTKRLTIHFPADIKGQAYFPFQVGKLWVGLAPANIETVFVQDMTDDEYKELCQQISDCGFFMNRTLPTTIVLKPTMADAKKPMMDGDLPIWLMLADVGALYIEINGKPISWKYTAPWYDSQQSQQLMTLFGN